MPLVIYAFYGLGKTTLATQYPDVYYDDDWAVPSKPPYSHQPVILTNDHNRSDIDAYVLPKDFNNHCLRLIEKQQFFKQYGDKFVKKVYNNIKQLRPIECDNLTHEICNQLKTTGCNKK